jgi:ribulose-phosphate 3-epimerase
VSKNYVHNRFLRSQKLNFILYRFRYLLLYILFCGLALLSEIYIYKALIQIDLGGLSAKILSMIASVFIAFFLNIKFNFKLPHHKVKQSLIYFIIISISSALLNSVIREQISSFNWSYEKSRLVVAGACFIFGYLLHRKFSFKSYKRVGVAIYANGVEDVDAIYDKIYFYTDFIHIDVVDSSYKEGASTDLSQISQVRDKWPSKPIHVHIMSKRPSEYTAQLAPYVDLIIVHEDIEEDLDDVLASLYEAGVKVGICIQVGTALSIIDKYLDILDVIQVLSINQPGFSGQKFNTHAYELIDSVNKHSDRDQFSLCVDGGVNLSNITKIDAEYLVSGSCVLNSENPPLQVRRLQTSLNYERSEHGG